MFFSKFFKKDHRHYLTRGGKHLTAERYSDARADFDEALTLCPVEAVDDAAEIRAGLARAGNGLGELNLKEGGRSVLAGELEKAFDHFTLACELAVDETIKAMAAAELGKLQQPDPTPLPITVPKAAAPAASGHGGSCGSCQGSGSPQPAVEIPASNLSDEDRFSLLVQPLQGELSSRYAALGPDFTRAYLLIHDGDDAAAFPILKEMHLLGENDIVMHELALIMFRSGRAHECEQLLNRALVINPGNSACYLALVHLLAEAKRFPEAIASVKRMMEMDILAESAQFMLGELYEVTGEEALAMEAWSKALEMPSVARSAAERLLPLLSAQGRIDEVKYLVKRYLKGCC